MKIDIRDLDEGIHQQEGEVSAGEIDLLDTQEFPNPIVLNIYIDRLEDIYRIKLGIKTEAKHSCDRCLVPFDTAVDQATEQIFQLGHSDLDDDDIEIIPENSKEIDISKAIREALTVNRPIKLLCRDDCKGLCTQCGENLNKSSCNCKTDEIDPRLAKLKSLLK